MAAASPETTSSSCSVAYAGPHTRVTLYLCVPESVCVREQCMCASIRCEAQTRNRRLCFLSLNPGYFADKSERLRQRIHGPASGCVVDDLEEQFGQRIGGMIRASLLEEYDAEEKAELRRRLATTSNGIEIEEEEHIFVSQSEVVELHQVTAPANGGSTNDSHCPDVEIDDTTLRRQIMEKFLAGFDDDFDYDLVDSDEKYDDMSTISRDKQDQYFDQESVESVEQDREHGQTGIQDF